MEEDPLLGIKVGCAKASKEVFLQLRPRNLLPGWAMNFIDSPDPQPEYLHFSCAHYPNHLS